jgi:triosephosphate isomerase (TIM)
MRQPIIAGNWKMNTSLDEAVTLAQGVRDQSSAHDQVQRVLIPPFPWIIPVSKEIEGSGITVGAQNCYSESSGAFTGEVSPVMLAPHCSHVVLGHSERRHVLGETDTQISAKVSAALNARLSVILCVGETLEEREQGNAERVVSAQLRSGLEGVSNESMANLVIAYEPVWAIGTGVAASTQDAQEMAAFVRAEIDDQYGQSTAAAIRIQYGGSVKGSNAAELLGCEDIDGALVGGASLDADDFSAIIGAAAAQIN